MVINGMFLEFACIIRATDKIASYSASCTPNPWNKNNVIKKTLHFLPLKSEVQDNVQHFATGMIGLYIKNIKNYKRVQMLFGK